MNSFLGLLWLEFQKNKRVLMILALVVAGWLVLMPSLHGFVSNKLGGQVNFEFESSDPNAQWFGDILEDKGTTTGVRALLILSGLAFPGLIGLAIFVFGLAGTGREGRDGSLQFLLMTPQSGYFHSLSRFAFLAIVSLLYFFLIIFSSIGAFPNVATLGADLFLGLQVFLFVSFAVLLPICGAIVMCDNVLSSYRMRGQFVIPFGVLLLGMTQLANRYADALKSISFRYLPAVGISSESDLSFLLRRGELPLEPIAVGLLLAGLFVALAGAVWNRLEV